MEAVKKETSIGVTWATVVMCVACSRKRRGEEVEESQGEKRLRRDRQPQINSESGESYGHKLQM